MHVKRLIGFGGAVVAAVALISSAGASTAASPLTKKTDLSTRGAVAKYLRSIHIDPKRVVIQRGLRNYAGSSCPGAGWTCTSTSHPVVQVSAGAGRNVFQCATSRCAVVQTAAATLATNTANCIRTTGITQSCSITQSSATANNQAVVVETASKATGLTQSASQTAQIVQQATGGSNTACVSQTLNLSATTVATKGTRITESLDGHQAISISQDSVSEDSVSGANVVENATASGGCDVDGSTLTQLQTISQTASGPRGITQNENAAASGPNMLVDIEQTAASGTNAAAFSQTSSLTATAYTPNGPVSQTQSSLGGGLTATVNQFSTGLSTSSAIQTETQEEHAYKSGTNHTLPPNTTQVQHGPVRCCSNQANNPADSFSIDQSSTQTNDTHLNQTNDLAADCSSSGTCTATQTTTVDGASTSNTQTGSTVSIQTTCSGSTCTSTTNVAFTTTGTGPGGATWTCFENHITNSAFPGNATSGGFDSLACQITGNTAGYIPGTYSGNPEGYFPPLANATWRSDYPPLNNELAYFWQFTVTANGDGTFTLLGQADYVVI